MEKFLVLHATLEKHAVFCWMNKVMEVDITGSSTDIICTT